MDSPLLTDIPALLGLLAVLAVAVHGWRRGGAKPAPTKPIDVKIAGRTVAPGRRHGRRGFALAGLAALIALAVLALRDTGGDAPGLAAAALAARIFGWAGLLNALLIAAQLIRRPRR